MTSTSKPSPERTISAEKRLDLIYGQLDGLWGLLEEGPSEKTKAQYRNADKRMRGRGMTPEEIGAKSRRSFNLYRAAHVFCTIERIAEIYDHLCASIGTLPPERADAMVTNIESELAVLDRYPPRCRDLPSRWTRPPGRAVRKGKRIGLSSLPINWRQRMVKGCVGSDYHVALMVLTLTGLRPAELEKGVRVKVDAAGHLVFTIHGAKVTATTGQPMRHLWMYVDDPVTRRLASHVESNGGADGIVVSIANARQFCDDVRGLSSWLFKRCKYVASPYSFRHAFAADMKAENVSPEELAMMMGHVADTSQRGYGSRNQGRLPFIHIQSVTATRPVRAAKVSAKAAAWVATGLADGCRYSDGRSGPASPAVSPKPAPR